MYEYVLVPFDGTPELRAALTPAADLAWRCGAKVVVVSTTEASDESSRHLLKSEAIAQSGADIDFWVDLEQPIGDALVAAALHRPNSVICAASRHRMGGLRRRGPVVPIPSQVFTKTAVPIVAIGPETDVSRGLPLTEVIVVHDGSPGSTPALDLAIAWGTRMKVTVNLVGLVGSHASDDERNWLIERLEAKLAEIGEVAPSAALEVVESDDAIDTLTAMLIEHRDAVLALDRRDNARPGDPLGPLAAGLLARAPRALVFPGPPA